MRKMIRILAVVLATVIQIPIEAHAQQQPSQVVSVGGGPSTGGSYSQFSVVGGEPVQSSVSGGTYSGEVGFLFGTRVEYVIPVALDAEVEIEENSVKGTPVHTVVAIDSDNTALSYSITAGNASGAFAINATTGAITVANASQLDYETVKTFVLTVSVSDATNTDEATITVNLKNLNDNKPVAVNHLFELNENSQNGTAVHTVSATDADGDVLSYRIVAGNGSGAFSIDAVSGAIRVTDASKLDYELNPQFVLTVRVSDQVNTGDGTITINLINLNDTGPVATDAVVELDESSVADSRVHLVGATDPDGSVLTYSITAGNESGAFAINTSTGAITVADASQLDFEIVTGFSLTVRVSDGANSVDVVVAVHLMNLNDNSPVAEDKTVELDENSSSGTLVHIVAATDADGDVLSYSITAGNSSGAFIIDSSTGAITVTDAAKLDFETLAQFVLTVRVSDGIKTDDATITVNLRNVDDIPRYSISGNVLTPEGNTLINGKVILLQDENGSRVQVTTTALNSEGKFLFQDIKEGAYTLKLVPTPNNQDPLPLLITYLGGSQFPAEAQVFQLTKNSSFPNMEVLRELPVEQEWKGNSTISGILVEDEKSSGEGGRIMSGLHLMAGTPMADAQVFLTDPTTKAVKFSVQTDAEGKFAFKGIASRKYGFQVEYKGKSIEMPQEIDLSKENSTVEVTAVVSEKGVEAVIEPVTAIKGESKEVLSLYPNPIKDKLILKMEGLFPGPLEIMVMDGQGKVLKSLKFDARGGTFIEEVDFSSLPSGLYLISFRQQDSVIYRKVLKQ